jgi:hypothetical protein
MELAQVSPGAYGDRRLRLTDLEGGTFVMTGARSSSLPITLAVQLPPFGLALLIADWFFKFGSFSLECISFLALWFALARVWRWLASAFGLDWAAAVRLWPFV